MKAFASSYRCLRGGERLGTVELSVPGAHNVSNSLAAVLVGLELGIPFSGIVSGIKEFYGTKRRFQLRADADGVMLIDDYAHHPTEIRAVLATCANWKGRRVVVVFQPHRYTRTRDLADDFGACFAGADKIILTDIYPASEQPIDGVSAELIRDRIRKNGIADVEVAPKAALADLVMKIKKPGDIVLVLGAGDIKNVANELAERFNGASVR